VLIKKYRWPEPGVLRTPLRAACQLGIAGGCLGIGLALVGGGETRAVGLAISAVWPVVLFILLIGYE